MTTNAQKTLAARAAIVGTALAAFSALPCAVSASIIYQDSFSGSSTLGSLNGAAPTTGPSGSTWTASTSSSYGWSDSGYTSDQSASARQVAYLAFTPAPGHVYTLTAGLDVTGTGSSSTPASSDGNYWAALGYVTTLSTQNFWDGATNFGPPGGGGASPWVLSGYKAANDAVFQGPGTAGGQGFAPGITSGVNTYSIVLNTGSAAYSYQVFLTNSANTNLKVGWGTFGTNTNPNNPVIKAVGLENGLGIAQVTDFSLTEQAVPEPATLGLVALGGLGLLFLKRRKAV